MAKKNPHDKIIKELCKEILFPIGVFQKGTSRLYIDDNGYYFTVIEFQPSSWSKGTYLNIALHFLWREQNYISYDFSLNNSRVKPFAAYENEDQFKSIVREYVEYAKEKVFCYRELQEQKNAIQTANKWCLNYGNAEKYCELLKGIENINTEEMLERIRKSRSYWHSVPSMKKMPFNNKYDYCS